MRHHVVISGTGRAGTTFLIQVLTHLGMDTGFSPSQTRIENPGYGGLEIDIANPRCPYIVKWPHLCDSPDSLEGVSIDNLVIPMRDLFAAAESRRRVTREAGQGAPGGLWHTHSLKPGDQERILTEQLYSLVLFAAKRRVPVTFLHYPTFVRDPDYLFSALRPVFPDMAREVFGRAYQSAVLPHLVHSLSSGDK